MVDDINAFLKQDTIQLPMQCIKDLQSKHTITLRPIADEVASHIITDKLWLQENILCLFSNAVKYSNGGAITLETLEHAAQAMNCKLVYALVPHGSLEETIKAQARKVAQKHLRHVGHTMRLENQGVSDEAAATEHERLVHELMRGNLHRLWDEE